MTSPVPSATDEERVHQRVHEREGPQPESSGTASKTTDKISIANSQPIYIDGDVNSHVSDDTFDMSINEEALARYENRPKIVSDVTWDEDATRRSIEIEPLFGESKEQCKKRITELFNAHQDIVGKYYPTSTIPDWMTPDLLYRINYGPLTNEESYKVASFLQRQLSHIEAARYSRSHLHRTARSWNSMLPFRRSPICPAIDFRDKKGPKATTENPTPVVFGCLDPKLGVELLSQLYPTPSDLGSPQGGDFNSKLRRHFQRGYSQFQYTPKAMEVDMHVAAGLLMFENNLLRLCRRRFGFGETMVFPMGALALDVVELIEKMKSSMRIDSDFAQLEMVCRQYLFSPSSYLSTAERGRSYASSTTSMFMKTMLFTKDNQYLQTWDQEDKFNDFFFRALSGRTQTGQSNSQRYDLDSSRLDISNLDASYICSGQFRLMLTACLEKHLHLDKDGLLYVFWDFTHEIGSSLDIYRRHFLWDPSGDLSKCFLLETFLTSSTIDEFQKELRLTHEILFTRSISSRKLGERFYGRSIVSTTVWGSYLFDDVTSVSLRDHIFDQTSSNISNFRFFGSRIVYLLQSMDDWRPRTFREVFIPGYSDRRDWWIAMFALFFGFITVLGLGLSVYQAYLAQRQVALALEGLNATPTH